LTNNGELYAAGCGYFYATGQDTEHHVKIPALVVSLSGKKVINVSCGELHTLANTDNGECYSWGCNQEGQCGIGHISKSVKSPTRIEALATLKIVSICAKKSFGFAVSESGETFSWGKNLNWVLGHGDIEDKLSPTIIKTLAGSQIIKIVCAQEHAAALDRNGCVWTWGLGQYGRLGTGNELDQHLPQKLVDFGNVINIALGKFYTIFILNSGLILFAGDDQYARFATDQPGHISLNISTFPKVEKIKFVEVVNGGFHTLAVSN